MSTEWDRLREVEHLAAPGGAPPGYLDQIRSTTPHSCAFCQAPAERVPKLVVFRPGAAICTNCLASALAGQGKYAEAEGYDRKALNLRLKLLGEEHPTTATSYSNLAVALSKQEKHAEAEQLHRKALSLRRKRFAVDHDGVVPSTYSIILTNGYAFVGEFVNGTLSIQ